MNWFGCAKRLLSLLLCCAMLLGMLPGIVLRADAEETVLDAAIFCSDVHGSTSDLKSVLAGVKTSGVTYSSIGFVGDTCLTVANTQSTVNSALGYTPTVMFSYAKSHDTESGADIANNWNYSGEVAGVSANYLVYTIRETDMQNASDAATAAPAFTTWYNGLTDAQKALPIFIISHRPMHYRRGDNDGGETWYNAISAAADSSDIFFFWGHNHTGDDEVDQAAYYVAKDGSETITLENGTNTNSKEKGSTVTPNFTYANAGYVCPPNGAARVNVATAVRIYKDSVNLTVYNASGVLTGTYAVNQTVEREFAASESEVTLESIAVTTMPTKVAYTVGEEFTSEGMVVTATYSDGETAPVEGYTLSEVDMTAAGTQTVTVTYEGLTATFDITVSEDAPVVTLESIAVSGTTRYTIGDEKLELTVTASYDNGTTADVTADSEFSGCDLTASGVYTVTVSYEGKEATIDVTVAAHYETEASDVIEVVSQGVTGVTATWDDAAEAVLEEKALFGDYVVYAVTMDNYTEDTSTEYAMTIPEDMDTTNLGLYHVAADGALTEVPYVIENDCIVFTTTLTGTFAYGALTLDEDYVLDSIAVSNALTDYHVGDSLYTAGDFTVTATYKLEGAEDSARVILPYEENNNPDGYTINMDSFDMTEAGTYNVEITYNGVSTTFPIHVWGETFEDVTGVTVTVGEGEYGVTTANVAKIENENVAAAVDGLLADGYVAYDITLSFADGYVTNENEKTVTLPIPEGVTNPVVYYVPTEGDAEKMTSTVDGENVTFTTTHFSTYVVGEDGTQIPTDSEDAKVDSNLTTKYDTQEVTVYKLVNNPDPNKQYLIINSDSGTGYGLDGDALGYNVTKFTGGSDYYFTWDSATNTGTPFTAGSDVYTSATNPYLWTVGAGLTFTHEEANLGILFTEASGCPGETDTYTLSFSTENSWTYTGNNLNNQTYNSYYLTCSSNGSWSVGTTGTSVYFYEPVTLTKVTTSTEGTEGGTYTAKGTDVETYAVANATVDLSSTLTFTTTSGTASNPTDWTANYEVVNDKGNPAVISSIDDNVATLSGTVGTAIVRVTYTNGTLTAWDEFGVTAKAPSYDFTVTEPESTQLKIGAGLTLVANPTMNGEATTEGSSITWTSSDDTIATVDKNGKVTAKAAGNVTITASWTDPSGETHTDTVSLDVVDAIYALDLCEPVYTQATAFAENTTYFTLSNGVYTAATNVTAENFADGTYYTQTTVSITAPIVIKNVTAGQTYTNLWAVITADGVDIGALNEEQLKNLSFISSDNTIATVDSATGVVTFQGETGTVRITAIYEYADGKQVTDTVEISVSEDSYTRPEDGTSVDNVPDFPEYPNPGAIRFDKHATAVGNFSETGVTKVELSMTGVPYGTSTATDVVVMVDMTSSMEENDITAAKLAVQELIETVVYDEENDTYDENIHLFVSSFSSGTTTSNIVITDHLDDVTISNSDELTAAKNAITDSTDGFRDDRHSTNGTHYGVALADVYATLTRDGHADNQFVVFVTDGVPTRYYYLNDSGSYTEVTGSNSDTKSLAAGWFDDEGEVTTSFQTEYYTYLIKEMGVPVYTVGANLTALSDAADLINHMSSNYSSDGKTSTGESKYSFTCTTSGGITDEVLEIFRGIGADIREAAKDVVVADEITDEYTMIFEAPNDTVADAVPAGQEFYIEVTEYTLKAVTTDGVITDYIRDTATSKMKLYLGESDGAYYAASDANGTEFAEPTFNQTALGTKFYWTTDSTKGGSVAQVTVDGTTYYFISTGIKNTDEDFDSTKWFNMASGAYASGTKDPSGTSQNLIIATPYFVYNAATKMLVWTAEKLNSTELALSYFLYLNNSAGYVGTETELDAGTYETNEKATITYTNVNGKECQQEFPVPQMTWNGAQVHYVFYLVNEAGQPVNRAGRVIPFSEAIYVTDVFGFEIVWNDLEQVASLEAEYLAEDLVPDVYELYDSGATYNIHVFEDEKEQNLNNHFVIGSTSSNYTTYVFNAKSDGTKYNMPGAYAATSTYKCKEYVEGGEYSDEKGSYNIVEKSGATIVETGFDFSNTTVAFAVVWKPELVSDTVVIDYGLDVNVNVVENDALSSGVVGIYNAAPNSAEINKGTYDQADDYSYPTSAEFVRDGKTLATATTDSTNRNIVKISLNKDNGMLLNDPLVFYYESAVNYYVNNELQTDNMYSSLTVIPATTVYYEDEYVTLKSYVKDEDGNYQEVTKGSGWEQESQSTSKTQGVDRPGANKIGGDYDADNIYGYDEAYANSSTYSMGNAAMVTVNAEKYATAEFEFYGTGFDVISMTSNTTGSIVVRVYPWNGSAYNMDAPAASYIVDTYYGYTYDSSIETDKNGDGEVNDEDRWKLSTNTPNSLYQVPVMKIEGLKYGRYKAVITCDYLPMFDHNGTKSYDFYLDAIRIYDPAGDTLGDLNETEENAYAADGELLPNYYELRNWLISKDTFDSAGLDSVNGIVFIDSNDATSEVADYSNYGPNNELYLAPGQAIAFNLNAGNETNIPAGYLVDQVHIAYKSVGGTAYAKIYDPEATTKDDAETLTVSTATDLYFNITALNDGNVVIANAGTTGNAILSITNVKVTYKAAETVEQAKTSLRNYLNAVGTLTEANYTEDSWTSYNNALSAANTELEKTEATIESVTEVHAELKTAYEALELKDAANEASVANVFTVTAAETGVALMSLRRTVVDDETTEEETTEPEATEPETTVPETTEPEATEPEVTEPETTEPEETEPEATEPENNYQQRVEKIVETAKKVYNFISNLFSRWF